MKTKFKVLFIIAIICGGIIGTGIFWRVFMDPKVPITSRDFKIGIAGFSPANMPNPSASDWTNYFNELPKVGEIMGAYSAWDISPNADGIPSTIVNGVNIAEQYGVTPIIAIGYTLTQVTSSTYFTQNKANFKKAITATATAYTPEYLAIGMEVNSLYWKVSPAAFNDFVAFYKEAYDAVKAISPTTKVFTVFQLEVMKGEAYLMGLDLTENWNLIDAFGERLDLVGFTIYPFLEYWNTTIDQIPDNYYLEIAEHVDKPIAITEMGWPSDSEYVSDSSEQAQIEFLSGLLSATTTLDVEFMLNLFLHDIEVTPEMFSTTGFKTTSGAQKQSYRYWQQLKSIQLS